MLELNFDPFPIIETERLLLRRMTMEDEEDMLSMRSEIDVLKYLDQPFFTRSKDEFRETMLKIENGLLANEMIAWAISLKHDPKLIGTISYHKIFKPHYRAEIGYLLSPGSWHKGLMSEAVQAVISYGFNKMDLHSIEAHVSPENKASIMLLERNQFVKEGYLKESYFFNGSFFDTLVYGLVKTN